MPPHPFAALLMLREFALFLEAERLANLPAAEETPSSGNIEPFTRNITYDNLGHALDLKDVYGNTSLTSSEVVRTYDGYGELLSDRVVATTGGVSANVSYLTQAWDAGGRRSNLQDGGTNRLSFGHNSAGQVTSVAEGVFGCFTFNSNFDTNGLLLAESNAFSNVTVNARDGRGRLLAVTRAEGAGYTSPVALLTENMTWNADGRMATYALTRNGTGTFNETRDYAYDQVGRLLSEEFGTASGNTATSTYGFDANKLGVRVSANTTDSPSPPVVAAGNWTIPSSGLNGFAQATLEQSGAHYLTANGTVNGPILSLAATLDGSALAGLAYSTNGTTGLVSWSAPMVAGLGNHSLVVSAGRNGLAT